MINIIHIKLQVHTGITILKHIYNAIFILILILIWYPMVYFILCEINGFPHQFPLAWENAVKSIKLEELGKLVPIPPPPTYWYFSSIRFPFYGILYHMGNTWFFSSISNSMGENASKQPFETSSWFSIVLLFVLVPKSGDSLKEQTGKTDKVKLLF